MNCLDNSYENKRVMFRLSIWSMVTNIFCLVRSLMFVIVLVGILFGLTLTDLLELQNDWTGMVMIILFVLFAFMALLVGGSSIIPTVLGFVFRNQYHQESGQYHKGLYILRRDFLVKSCVLIGLDCLWMYQYIVYTFTSLGGFFLMLLFCLPDILSLIALIDASTVRLLAGPYVYKIGLSREQPLVYLYEERYVKTYPAGVAQQVQYDERKEPVDFELKSTVHIAPKKAETEPEYQPTTYEL